MKINSISFSVKVWLTTIISAPILSCFYFFILWLINPSGDLRGIITMTLGISIFAFILSIPSFIIFTTVIHFISAKSISIILKKLILAPLATLLTFTPVLIYNVSDRLLSNGLIFTIPFWLTLMISICFYKLNPKSEIGYNGKANSNKQHHLE